MIRLSNNIFKFELKISCGRKVDPELTCSNCKPIWLVPIQKSTSM